MVDVAVFVILAGLLVIAAHLFTWLFSYTAVPDALLLIAVGIIIGPGLGLVTPDLFGDVGTIFLTVALVIMLFEGGVALHLGTLRQAAPGMVRLMLTSFVLATLGVGLLLWWATDLPLLVALAAGAIVGDTTSSVVLTLLKRLVLGEKAETILILEATMSDVIAVVVTVALIAAYQTGVIAPTAVASTMVISMGVAALVGLLVGLAWALLLDKVRHLQNSMFITAAMAFLVYGVLEALGFSGLIAVLIFGMTLGNMGALNHYLSTRHHLASLAVHPVSLSRRERAFFGELVFLLQTFFFVYLGITVQLANTQVMLLAAGATALLLFLRFVAVRASVPRSTGVREASFMAVMIPKGLTSVVLALLLVVEGIPGAQLVQEFSYMMVLLTIAVTALSVFLLEKTPLSRVYARLLSGYGTNPLPGIRRSV